MVIEKNAFGTFEKGRRSGFHIKRKETIGVALHFHYHSNARHIEAAFNGWHQYIIIPGIIEYV